jgi:hypothetical protein
MKKIRVFLVPLCFLVLTVLSTVCLTEGAFAMLLLGPSWFRRFPNKFRQNVQALYMDRVRNIIQFDNAFARYDPDLYYTLKPGEFVFSNPEFGVRFHVNSAGLRDSEEALNGPELIALGDSFTMGWGVGQDETYPRLLAHATGLRTLDAGIAGFETVRQLRLLDRLDTSKLKFLVIQYGDGDSENTAYYCAGNRLDIGSQQSFADVVRERQNIRRYRFGKYTLLALENLHAAFRPRRQRKPSPPECDAPGEADLFLNALTHATKKNLAGVKLIVFTVGSYSTQGREFLRSLRRRLDSGRYPSFAKKMRMVVMDDHLDPSAYFAIDDHLNSSGQRRIAAELLRALSRQDGLTEKH